MKKLSVLFSGLLFFSLTTFAQEGVVAEGGEGMHPHSLRPIHSSDIMWKKTIIRAMDMREQQNEPLFSKNKELTRVIIEAAKAGEIKIWATDSLDFGTPLTLEKFLEALQIPSEEIVLTDEEKAFMETETAAEEKGDDLWGDFDVGAEPEEEEEETTAIGGIEYYNPKDIYQLEIKEDMIFDKQRSRMYYDIHAITLKVPADHPLNIKGIEVPIASFSYKELVDKAFNNNPDAIWYNPYNDAEHKKLADAFELRLFSSYIVKVSNPNNDYIVDIYGGDQWTGIMASQWKAFELLEFEHNLWEF